MAGKQVVVLQAECLLAQPQVAPVECFRLLDAALTFRYLCKRPDSVGNLDVVGTERRLESGQCPPVECCRRVKPLQLLERSGGRYHRFCGQRMGWSQRLLAYGHSAALVRLGVRIAIEPAQYLSEPQQRHGDLRGLYAIRVLGQRERPFGQRQRIGVLPDLDEVGNLPLERFKLELALGRRVERQKHPNQHG